jgi:hypothetical protein
MIVFTHLGMTELSVVDGPLSVVFRRTPRFLAAHHGRPATANGGLCTLNFGLAAENRAITNEEALTLFRQTGPLLLEGHFVLRIGLHGRQFSKGWIVGVAMRVDRSNGAVNLAVPLASLIAIKVETFEPDRLPRDLARTPAVKPGGE